MVKQQFPELTVGALIFNSQGQIFLMRSYKWKDKWVIPGGHVELGETLEQALKREIKEETGLGIYDIKFLLFQEFIYDKAFWQKKHFIFFDFICKTKSLKVKLNSEGQKYLWVKPTKALHLNIEPYTKKAILKYLRCNLNHTPEV